MRSALPISSAMVILAAASAYAQINPNTQIKWPTCTAGAQFYSIPGNSCVVGGGGGGGGANPNPPAFSIQFAANPPATFASDPTITEDPVNHVINVGTPNANPTFHLQPLGTIAADWTQDVTSPQTAIDSLTGTGTEGNIWTWHSGIGQWEAAAPGGVTSVVPTATITCSPCTGAVQLAVTGGGNAFSAISSGTNTGAAMNVGSGASLVPSGSGEIQATHSTQTGLTQCLNSLSDGTIQGAGAACNAFSALQPGTNTNGSFFFGTGASLDTSGSGTINANVLAGVSISGTPSAGWNLTATGPTAAIWQAPAGGTQSEDVIVTSGICTTSGSSYGECASPTAVSWATAFADTSYTITCQGYNPGTAVTGLFIVSKSATGFSFTLQNGTANGAHPVTFTEVDCHGSHP